MPSKRDDSAQPKRAPRGALRPLAKVPPPSGSVSQRTSGAGASCSTRTTGVEVVCNDNADPGAELTDAEVTLVTWLIRQELKKWER